MIAFGPWSTLLGLGALFGLLVALGLARQQANRAANLALAALLLALVMMLMPYVIGFAGYYDAYPWLSYAPFDWQLAFGPLLWLHVRALTEGRPPALWPRHLLPAAVQGAYQLVMFVQPLARKNAWDSAVHAPYVDPLLNLAWVLSLALYLAASWRQVRRYRLWLRGHVSNDSDHRLPGLYNLLLAMAALLAGSAVYDGATRLLHLNYFDRFPLYVGLTALVYMLGLEGWRHADRVHPVPGPSEVGAVPEPVPEARNWRREGEAWRARLAEADWWRDPELGLDSLARHLGTNTAYLSRAFNEGLGQSFSDVVGSLRVAWVQAELARRADIGDLLALAFEAGFSSKTSFNRVFKAQTGLTPSQFRAQARAES